jgi:hypothetical protein
VDKNLSSVICHISAAIEASRRSLLSQRRSIEHPNAPESSAIVVFAEGVVFEAVLNHVPIQTVYRPRTIEA